VAYPDQKNWCILRAGTTWIQLTLCPGFVS
jgi:hypothetical protein